MENTNKLEIRPRGGGKKLIGMLSSKDIAPQKAGLAPKDLRSCRSIWHGRGVARCIATSSAKRWPKLRHPSPESPPVTSQRRVDSLANGNFLVRQSYLATLESSQVLMSRHIQEKSARMQEWAPLSSTSEWLSILGECLGIQQFLPLIDERSIFARRIWSTESHARALPPPSSPPPSV